MKRFTYYMIVILGMAQLASFISCSENDKYSSDNEAPIITLEKEADQWVPGREYTINAQIKENTGMKKVHILSSELGLNEDINFGRGLVTDFKLVYSFNISEVLSESGSYIIKIDAVDVAGNISSSQMTLSLDGDIDAPVFSVVPPKRVDLVGAPSLKYQFNLSVIDNKELDFLRIICPEMGRDDLVKITTGKEYSYTLDLDLGNEVKNYNFSFIATDKAGLTTEITSLIVVDDMPDFAAMYLADVFTEEELNSDIFGVPVYMDHVGTNVYEILFFNNVPGKEIMFIPQPESFSPHCFGASSDGSGVEYAEKAEGMNKFVLADKGYYRIRLNTKARTYSAVPERVVETIQDIMLTGAGIADRGDWSLDYVMKVLDADNPYEVYDIVEFKENASFCTTNAEWATVWTPSPKSGPTIRFIDRTISGIWDNCPAPIGKYMFRFNYVTGQVSLIKY